MAVANFNFVFLVLEISTHDYGYQNDRLVAETLNGSQILYRKNHRHTVQNIAMQEAGKLTDERRINES